jgi:hypothetical protein
MAHSRRIAPITTCIIACLASIASAAEAPAEYRETVSMSNLVGAILTLHHLSTKLANDEMERRGVLKKDQRVQGWITEIKSEPQGVLVTYVGDEGGVPHALYRVMVTKGRTNKGFEALSPAQPLSKAESARFAARTLAIADFAKRGERCAPRYDALVFPMGRHGDPYMYVYMLAATDESRVAIAGGDMRYEISADGVHIDDRKPLTENCATLSIPRAKDRDKAAPNKMTLGEDPTPNEWHAFLTRRYYQALDIETPDSRLAWSVRAGKIEFVGKMED